MYFPTINTHFIRESRKHFEERFMAFLDKGPCRKQRADKKRIFGA